MYFSLKCKKRQISIPLKFFTSFIITLFLEQQAIILKKEY